MTTRTITKPQRTVIRPARFTPAEWARVEDRARACGIGPSTYLREVALGVELEVRAGALEREVVYHLARIGNNLNQLTRAANALRRVELSSRLELTLAELRAALRRVVA
jgi:chromosomal replication initiation ATPase DnaA